MKKYVPKIAIVSLLILTISIFIYIAAISSVAFADKVNDSVGAAARFLFALITRPLPFSLFEVFIILSPAILITVIVCAIRRGKSRVERVRFVLTLISVISLIFTSYIYTLGVGYHSTPIDEKTGIEEADEITKEELFFTVNKVLDEIERIAPTLVLDDGETKLSYSMDELSARLVDAYDVMLERYPILTNYDSRLKPVYFSTVMSDLGITGIYGFFTGEANVNVEYPDYCVVFTSAHEMAHQRGVSRENEANFVAFLVTVSSDDDYIRYCGYLNLYEYLISSLYRADVELYKSASARLHTTARADINAARVVYNKHKDSPLGKINDRLNDAYLKANGTEGIVTYGYVVKLAVGYYCRENNQ